MATRDNRDAQHPISGARPRGETMTDTLTKTGAESPEAPGAVCPECGEEFIYPLDVCDDCGEDFGDCDGSCGNPDCGNNHCMHCGGSFYSECCPHCRESLPVEMWI